MDTHTSSASGKPIADVERLVVLAEMGRHEEIRPALDEHHEADIADLIDALEEAELKRTVFGYLSTRKAAAVLTLISDLSRQQLLRSLSEAKLEEILATLESDDATDLLGDLPHERVERVLRAIPKRLSEELRSLLRYDEESAGGIMQKEFVAVDASATVRQAIETLRRRAAEVENFHKVFVIDRDQKLLGSVSLSRLILAAPTDRLADLMETDILAVPEGMDQEEVAALFRRYDEITLPVVDANSRLIGRITIDDIVDVIEEEASEDFYRLAGLGEDEQVLDPPLRSVRRRLPWLALNLATALVAASVVALFEETIESYAIAAALMTIVAGQGGNAGIQTLTVVVRGLALGELTLANARRVLLKEITTAIINGLAVGFVAGAMAYMWQGNAALGAILAIAMVANLVIAALVGTLIPLGLKRCSIDPAVASSVVLTTFTDVCGFFAFLGLLTLFSPLLH